MATMAQQAARLARLFTIEYARRVNAQIVHPVQSVVVKPTELRSSLVRPLNTALYEPHSSPADLAASLSFGIIMGHPFMDGNKRTAYFLANEYARAMGLSGLADETMLRDRFQQAVDEIADFHVFCAAGTATQLDLKAAIAKGMGGVDNNVF